MALDLARCTGVAEGFPPSPAVGLHHVPKCWSIRLAPAGAPAWEVRDKAYDAFRELWPAGMPSGYLPTTVVIEEPILTGRATSKAVLKSLWGLASMVEFVARRRGIRDIRFCTADEARRVFLGTNARNIRGEDGKRRVREHADLLGWKYADADGADALACLCWGWEQVRPGSTAGLLPIFGGRAHDGGAGARVE
jgi:hypothetical protein